VAGTEEDGAGGALNGSVLGAPLGGEDSAPIGAGASVPGELMPGGAGTAPSTGAISMLLILALGVFRSTFTGPEV